MTIYRDAQMYEQRGDIRLIAGNPVHCFAQHDIESAVHASCKSDCRSEEVADAVRLEVRQASKEFIDELRRDPPRRIPGTSIVLGRMAKGVPLALSHNVKCNRVLQEHVLLVAVTTTLAIASWRRRYSRERGSVVRAGRGLRSAG